MKLLSKKLKDKKGFTLIELVVVIAVIAILAAIAIPYFSGVTEKANLATDRANYRMLQSAVSMYLSEAKNLPASATTLSNAELGEYIEGGEISIVKTGESKGSPFTITYTPASGSTPASCDITPKFPVESTGTGGTEG